MRCYTVVNQYWTSKHLMFPFTGFSSKTHSGARARLNISSTVQKTNRQKTKTIQELLKVPFQTEMNCRFNSITKWDEDFMIYFLQSTMFFAVNNWMNSCFWHNLTFQKWIKYNSQDKCFLCVNQLVRETLMHSVCRHCHPVVPRQTGWQRPLLDILDFHFVAGRGLWCLQGRWTHLHSISNYTSPT